MQRFFHYLIIALSCAFFISIIACDPECPVPEDPNACNSNGTCNKGFECIDNTCQCPEPGYEKGGWCIQFSGQSPAWKGLSTTCYCYDTLSFGISGQGSSRTLGMSFIEGGLLGSAATNIQYFEKPSGDSFYVFQMPVKCPRPNGLNKSIPEAFGKIKPNGDLLLRLVFRDGVTLEYIDECVTTMKKVY